jgi:hypothetical protein
MGTGRYPHRVCHVHIPDRYVGVKYNQGLPRGQQCVAVQVRLQQPVAVPASADPIKDWQPLKPAGGSGCAHLPDLVNSKTN